VATVSIPLASRKYPDLVTFVDEEDYERVSRYRWHPFHTERSIYAQVTITDAEGRDHSLLMHRLLMDAPKGVQVDHIDGDGLNNRRRTNLRLATLVGGPR
jgi:hypothetical protein